MINGGIMVIREQLERSPAESNPQGERITNYTKTHCKRGHPLSGGNLYTAPRTGWRYCRACSAIHRQNSVRKAALNGRGRFGGNRDRAIQRDGYKCVKCGMTRREHKTKYGRDITVDHIDGNGRYTSTGKQNHNLSNLQTLCLPCHGKKDVKRRKNNAPRAKLSADQVANIRHLRGTIPRKELADIYGVRLHAIDRILIQKTWKEIK